MSNLELAPGDTLNNASLMEAFSVGISGGMRRSHTMNSLVIVSDHTRGIYEDRWDGETLHYTGMGLHGDQPIDRTQNKTLAQSRSNGVEVHLFEVFQRGKYIYQGRVELAADPYEERQLDDDGKERRVWMFPVRLIGTDSPIPLTAEDWATHEERQAKKAKRLTLAELLQRLKAGNRRPPRRSTTGTQYSRDHVVKEIVLRLAQGFCQLCGTKAPFSKRGGAPYLETHHIVWLAKGGLDEIENTVALCPNCHRKMHVLNRPQDRKKLVHIAKTHRSKAESASKKRTMAP